VARIVNNTFNDLGIPIEGVYDGAYDGLIVKFDSLGNPLWARWLGSNSLNAILSLHLDDSNSIYVVGYSYTDNGFDDVPIWNGVYSGGSEGYLIKLNSSGNPQWGQWLGGSGSDQINSIDLDSSGNIYVAGQSADNSSFDDSGLLWNGIFSGTAYEGFVIKLNSSGSPQWGQWLGGTGAEEIQKIKLDSSNSIYVVGRSNDNTSFDDGGLTFNGVYSGSYEGYLIKLDSSGSPLWGQWFGGTGIDMVKSVDLDSSGNVYVAGYSQTNITDDGLTFGGDYSSSSEGFAVKFDSSGNPQWGQWFGGASGDYSMDLCLDNSNNNLYVAGYAGSTFDESGIIWNGTYSGSIEGYVVKLNSATGLPLNGYWFGGSSSDRLNSVFVDSSQNLYVSGGYSMSSGGFDEYNIVFNGVHTGSEEGFVIKLNPVYE
jgi:hypothetical protein